MRQRNNKALVTVTIPTFNSAKTLSLCLESIKRQTYKHIEINIIDGNSEDNTIKVAKSFGVSNVVNLPSSLLKARHKGVELAQGEYVLILDSDQILESNAIEKAYVMATKDHFDMLVFEERSYRNKTFTEKLFNMDRKLINKVNNLDPFTGVIMPRFFRTTLIKKAYDNIPKEMFANTGGPDHAIVYYEASLLSKKIDTVPNAVKHIEPDSIQHLLKKFYRWGYSSIDAHSGKYSSLMKKKERLRTGLFSKGLYMVSIGSIMLLLLKGIAFKTGFYVARLKNKSNINIFLSRIWTEAMQQNIKNIIYLLEKNSEAKIIDIGCGDGQESTLFKKKIGCEDIEGVDGLRGRLEVADKRGVTTIYADLEKKWQLPSNTYDVVISNQVIEHLVDIDNFIEEALRILKPGGYCVISTENLSSWHNVFALVFGFQDFSHHIIKKKHVNNPLSLHYGEKTASWSKEDHGGVDDSTYPHNKILTYRSLIKVFEEYGFKFENGRGSGYYPLFGQLSLIAARIDPYHSHFITVKMRK